jgi:hypothetical protein
MSGPVGRYSDVILRLPGKAPPKGVMGGAHVRFEPDQALAGAAKPRTGAGDRRHCDWRCVMLK